MKFGAFLTSLATLFACAPDSKYLANVRESLPQKTISDVIAEIKNGKTQTVLVVLRREAVLPLNLVQPPEDESARSLWLTRNAAYLAEAKQDLWNSTSALGVQAGREYEFLPIAEVQVSSEEGLQALTSHPHVLGVHPNRVYTTSTAQSLSLIQQPIAAQRGHMGHETSVAVIDTGADYRRADLGSCTAPGQPASCRVAYAQDFAPNDGLLDDSSLHGTNVSAIVAKVAPGTKILALDVFLSDGAFDADIISAINWAIANKATYKITALNMSLGGDKSTTPCPADPMSVAIKNARDAGILSAVASGNERYTDGLSYPACSPDAISVGAVYDSDLGPRNWSTCSDSTTAADKITCFSNSASFLTMLAPGALITAGGVTMAGTSQASPHVAGAIAVLRASYPTDNVTQLQTRLTSTGINITDTRNNVTKPRLNLGAAAPSTCGFTLLPASGNVPGAGGSVSTELVTGESCAWTLSANSPWVSFPGGTSGTGPKTLQFTAAPSAVTSPRTALITLSGTEPGALSKTYTLTQLPQDDRDAPTGTLRINDAAAWTRARTVALAITAQDASGVASMCISEGDTCTAFVPFANATSWTLSPTEGNKTLRVFLKDQVGNTTDATSSPSASIQLDLTPPTNGSLTATPASSGTEVSLSWAGFSDALSSVSNKLVVGNGGAIPSTCNTDTVLTTGTATTYAHAGLTPGTTYGYRVCAIDAAGNISTGASVQVTTASTDGTPPTGSIRINNGATWTKSRTVSLTLTAQDSSGVATMCISESESCTIFEAFSPTKEWTLSQTEGLKTLRLFLKDTVENVSTGSNAPSGAIILDLTPPTNGSLTATSTSGGTEVSLTWTGFGDSQSTVTYKLYVGSGGAIPVTCDANMALFNGTATTYAHTGLTPGTTYGYRVCAMDAAGNISTGAGAQVKTASGNTSGPSGTIKIANDAPFTPSLSVTLQLSATSINGVAEMCVSLTPSCSAWEPYKTSKIFLLESTSSPGMRTVYASFKDAFGNVGPQAQDSIFYDASAPVDGTFTAIRVAPGSREVTLTWSPATDGASSIVRYRLMRTRGYSELGFNSKVSSTSDGRLLPNCMNGIEVPLTSTNQATATGLIQGETYYFRLCAVDPAGNTSRGITSVVSTN